jgi:hypothetical protein
MKTLPKVILILIVLVILGALAYAYWPAAPLAPVTGTETPGATTTPSATPTATSTNSLSDRIVVTSPTANALVTSPLVVTGKARGTWYFEASFPVKVLDANGKVLAAVPAQAQGEWMTTEFVPFTVSVPFATSTTATGTLVLQKDNPSGLPENEAELRIPIRFK